jgi:uncharacterized protein
MPVVAGTVEVAASEVAPVPQVFPEDLQITWSWPHFVIFVFFGFVSLFVVQISMIGYYAPREVKLTPTQLEQYLISKPQFAIGSMVLWYAALFFFLYVTLAVLRGLPFWKSLGWRKIQAQAGGLPAHPLLYFFMGCGLSLVVAIVTSALRPPENIPIEELFKHRQTALLFIAMAVLVAPLVEETLFRGYLYPLFARSLGVGSSIVITGILFGLMHAEQLGRTWSLVSILVVVGIVFTMVRARTGSVFASYLMHLGYNSLISAAALLSTHGFTKMPTGQ